ncbi:hypothetical protein MRX96_020900 [Rhipicephalus microplus]
MKMTTRSPALRTEQTRKREFRDAKEAGDRWWLFSQILTVAPTGAGNRRERRSKGDMTQARRVEADYHRALTTTASH